MTSKGEIEALVSFVTRTAKELDEFIEEYEDGRLGLGITGANLAKLDHASEVLHAFIDMLKSANERLHPNA